MWQDLRHGARMLLKNPGFSLVAIVSIAIGVGANAAMFSVADTMVLRPITASRARELVTVGAVIPNLGFRTPTSSFLSYPDYVDIRDQSRSFASLMAYTVIVTGFVEQADQPAERKFGMAVSSNMLDVIGLPPALGRTFRAEEDKVAGRDPVVMLDYEMWRQQFASDPGVIDRRIRIGGIDHTVIGVTPSGFTGPDQFVYPSFYVPLAMLPSVSNTGADPLTRRDVRGLQVKGHLQPGVSIAQASQEAQAIAQGLSRSFPETNRDRGLKVDSEFGARVEARPPLAMLAAMLAGLAVAVLLVACANVAGLLASRAPVRAREIGLRLAIGAGRLRVMRQLITESLLLAVAGGALGLVVANVGIAIFQSIQIPSDVPLKFSFELDRRVMVVALAVAAVSAVLSSLLPAWRATRSELLTSLKNPTVTPAHHSRLWGRNTLVAGQVALSVVLLTVAVSFYRAFQTELLGGPGFRTDHILMMTFDTNLARYDSAKRDSFYQLLIDTAKTVPGISAATLASSIHMDPISIENSSIAPEGFDLPKGTESVRVRSAHVDEGFFDTMGIRIVRGRAIRATDTADTPPVAVVNETLAAHYWRGQDAVGKRFRLSNQNRDITQRQGVQQWIEIVGVASNVRESAFINAPGDFAYYSRVQNPQSVATLAVQTNGDAAALAAPVREMVRSLDADMPIFDVRTMSEFYTSQAIGLSSVLVRTIGGMGLMGFVLAMVGLYGLMAYAVSRRTREIGIRMAVGARPGAVLQMVLRHGLILSLTGIAIGTAGSTAAGGLLRTMFPSRDGIELTTYFVVVPALVAVTLLAAYIPARRAARIDPLIALRTD